MIGFHNGELLNKNPLYMFGLFTELWSGVDSKVPQYRTKFDYNFLNYYEWFEVVYLGLIVVHIRELLFTLFLLNFYILLSIVTVKQD